MAESLEYVSKYGYAHLWMESAASNYKKYVKSRSIHLYTDENGLQSATGELLQNVLNWGACLVLRYRPIGNRASGVGEWPRLKTAGYQ